MHSINRVVRAVTQSVALACVVGSLPLAAHAALEGRDADQNPGNGFEAYYDTVLGITWLADAGYVATSGYAELPELPWGQAVSWANGLDFHGVTGWRLPSVISRISTTPLDQIASGSGADAHNSELGHMYYTNLNLGADLSPNRGTVQIPGVDHGVILNFSSELFWTQDTYTPKPSRAWALWTSFPFAGSQAYVGKILYGGAWAVHDGDPFGFVPGPAPAVDEPASLWLLTAGLGVGAFMQRKRRVKAS